ncbi:hypothetical protein VNO77_19982 [Canavalia gladiata]|uniref:Uncharacterized protein n=1 Tax=Canavalia gladiata TaxID=3824 RepID=A0AAN9LSK3_CANGL
MWWRLAQRRVKGVMGHELDHLNHFNLVVYILQVTIHGLHNCLSMDFLCMVPFEIFCQTREDSQDIESNMYASSCMSAPFSFALAENLEALLDACLSSTSLANKQGSPLSVVTNSRGCISIRNSIIHLWQCALQEPGYVPCQTSSPDDTRST